MLSASVVDQLIRSCLGRVLDVFEFVCSEQLQVDPDTVLSMIHVLQNFVVELSDNPLVKGCLNRIVLCLQKLPSVIKSLRISHAAMTSMFKLLPYMDGGSLVKNLEEFDSEISPMSYALLIFSLSRFDLEPKWKERFIKSLKRIQPVKISPLQSEVLRHQVNCFAKTSPMASLLELEPLSSLYNPNAVNYDLKTVDLGLLYEVLKANKDGILCPSEQSISTKLQFIQQAVKDRLAEKEHLRTLDDGLTELINQLQVFST